MSNASAPSGGPIDGNKWPSQITAHVVDPGPPTRIHGYEIDGDIARNYTYTDVLQLALVGELPSEHQSKSLDLAMKALAAIDVAAAPSHAGVLARICGARSSAIIGIAALALAEHARHVVAEHAALFRWLEQREQGFPASCHAAPGEETQEAESLLVTSRLMGIELPQWPSTPTRIAACLSLIHLAGLKRTEQVETVMVLAQLPCVLAEAHAASAGAFNSYPMQLPPFRHAESP